MRQMKSLLIIFITFFLVGCTTYEMKSNVLLILPGGQYYNGELNGKTQSPSTSAGTVYFPNTPYGALEGKITTINDGYSVSGNTVSLSASGLPSNVGKMHAGKSSRVGKLYLKNSDKIVFDCDVLVEVVALSPWGLTYSIEGFGECLSTGNEKYNITFQPPSYQ
jgi:hypothetical protein